MLAMCEKGWAFAAEMREELAWLKAEHPEKTALIAAAEQWLGVIGAAGSTKSLLCGPGVAILESVQGVK